MKMLCKIPSYINSSKGNQSDNNTTPKSTASIGETLSTTKENGSDNHMTPTLTASIGEAITSISCCNIVGKN